MHRIQKIVLIRHGDYGNHGRISNHGREQMLYMADKIKSHTGAGSEGVASRIITSSAPHARDSAEVLADVLGLTDIGLFTALWSDNSGKHDQNNDLAIDIIRHQSVGVDVLIVVTHCEYASDLPNAYCEKILGLPPTNCPNRMIVEGQCAIISCSERAYSIVP